MPTSWGPQKSRRIRNIVGWKVTCRTGRGFEGHRRGVAAGGRCRYDDDIAAPMSDDEVEYEADKEQPTTTRTRKEGQETAARVTLLRRRWDGDAAGMAASCCLCASKRLAARAAKHRRTDWRSEFLAEPAEAVRTSKPMERWRVPRVPIIIAKGSAVQEARAPRKHIRRCVVVYFYFPRKTAVGLASPRRPSAWGVSLLGRRICAGRRGHEAVPVHVIMGCLVGDRRQGQQCLLYQHDWPGRSLALGGFGRRRMHVAAA